VTTKKKETQPNPGIIFVRYRWDGAKILWQGEAVDLKDGIEKAAKCRANLAGADLAGADLARANLAGANLVGANLAGADLARANLAGANLVGANLARANLAGANLAGAIGFNRFRCQWTASLRLAPAPVTVFKLVTNDFLSPMAANAGKMPIEYVLGQAVEVPNADTGDTEACGHGIHVASLAWCLQKRKPGWRILVGTVDPKDIASIPMSGEEKILVRKFLPVRELADSEIADPVVPKKAKAKAKKPKKARP